MIRVGFLAPSYDAAWLGGISYFRNLLGALADFPDPRIEPVLLTGSSIPHSLPPEFGRLRSIALTALQQGSPRWIARKIGRRLLLADGILRRALVTADIQVLSHFSGHLGRQNQVATLAWIPDFQHRYFPDLFSAAEYSRREKEFTLLCRNATRIVVSSHAAQGDLESFCPEARPKSRVLQFVANVPDPRALPSPDVICKKYKLPDRYFLLPNQFWKHKNHEVVLRALAILRAGGRAPVVIATGNTRDYRQPAHFNALDSYARAHGLHEHFLVPGVIPLEDLMALMRDSVAVVNPSRFEGWSTSVEEGKSMEKKILLSSIPVHLEQAPSRGFYFDPDDPEGLAKLMAELVQGWDPEEERRANEDAASQLPARRQAFALTYQNWVADCVG